jgi:hypothetical protein
LPSGIAPPTIAAGPAIAAKRWSMTRSVALNCGLPARHPGVLACAVTRLIDTIIMIIMVMARLARDTFKSIVIIITRRRVVSVKFATSVRIETDDCHDEVAEERRFQGFSP